MSDQPRAERTTDRDAAGRCSCGHGPEWHTSEHDRCMAFNCWCGHYAAAASRPWPPHRASSPPEAAAPSSEGLDGPRRRNAFDEQYERALAVINQQRERIEALEAALRQSPAPAERRPEREALVKIRAHTSYVNPSIELLAGLLASIERIADAALRESPDARRECVIGRYCHDHDFVHGAEAEELRQRLGKLKSDKVRDILDDVDARDSLAYLEAQAPAPDAGEVK